MPSVWCPACQRPHAEPLAAGHPWSDTDRELVQAVLHEADYYDDEAADAVLDALTAAGWRPGAGEALDDLLAARTARVRTETAEEIARPAATCGADAVSRVEIDAGGRRWSDAELTVAHAASSVQRPGEGAFLNAGTFREYWQQVARAVIEALMVDGWRPGPSVTGQAGWYVPADATHCPHCGDQNWDYTRLCLTCTNPDSPSSLRPWEMHSDAPARRHRG